MVEVGWSEGKRRAERGKRRRRRSPRFERDVQAALRNDGNVERIEHVCRYFICIQLDPRNYSPNYQQICVQD